MIVDKNTFKKEEPVPRVKVKLPSKPDNRERKRSAKKFLKDDEKIIWRSKSHLLEARAKGIKEDLREKAGTYEGI